MATYGDFSGVTDDPKETDIKMILEKECHFTDPVAMQLFKTYQKCDAKIKGTDQNCSGYYFDYVKAIDKCVGPKLFKSLR